LAARCSPNARPGRRLIAAALACALVLTPALPIPVAAQGLSPGLPDLGDISQVTLSPAQERKLGETIMRQARAQGGVMQDPEVNDYLNELGNRLVGAAPDGRQDFEFFAVADNSINAFALPGGFVGVNTGLILLAQNESELASVLAHEISHVTQRHMARMLATQQNSLLMTLAGLAVAILASRVGGSSSGDAISAALAASQALAIQNQLNFTRENEYEADRIGFQRLVVAGYDPRAMATLMERLQRSSRFAESGAPSYLRTHPITYERIAEAQARADRFAYRQVQDSLDFHLVRALLRSYQGDARDAVAFFDDALRERKYNNEIAAQYGLVASLLRARDTKRALAELGKLEKLAPPHPMIDAIAGHVLMESGNLDAAIKRFASALSRYPNKMQLVYDYPEALLRAGRPAEAAKFVERELERFPRDGQLHRIASQAYVALNMQLKQHQHLGEYYAWQGNLRGAISQLELALRANDSNFYDASVVDTRLRALRQELSEQQKEAFGRTG
jgi:predicted Zn-dependent protease